MMIKTFISTISIGCPRFGLTPIHQAHLRRSSDNIKDAYARALYLVIVSISYVPVIRRERYASEVLFSHGQVHERIRHELLSYGGVPAQMTSQIRPVLGRWRVRLL